MSHSLIVGMTQLSRFKGVLSRFGALAAQRVPMTRPLKRARSVTDRLTLDGKPKEGRLGRESEHTYSPGRRMILHERSGNFLLWVIKGPVPTDAITFHDEHRPFTSHTSRGS